MIKHAYYYNIKFKNKLGKKDIPVTNDENMHIFIIVIGKKNTQSKHLIKRRRNKLMLLFITISVIL